MTGRGRKIRDVGLQPLQVTTPDTSLVAAAEQMRMFEVGSLAVLESGALVGIITERDLARSIANRSDPEQVSASSYMTTHPMVVSADADVSEAMLLMEALGTRHLPVIDKGRPIGMISMRDLLRLASGTARKIGLNT